MSKFKRAEKVAKLIRRGWRIIETDGRGAKLVSPKGKMKEV